MSTGRAKTLFFSFFLVLISITFTAATILQISSRKSEADSLDKLNKDIQTIKRDYIVIKNGLQESSATLKDIKKKVYQINDRRRHVVKWAALPNRGGSWISHIDRYLAGTPLAGQGRAFYLAAVDYRVEPRLSPAIAMVESGAGAAIPGGHNYWGMVAGTVPGRSAIKAKDNSNGRWLFWQAWPDKETAIREHVRFIAKRWGHARSPYEMKGYAFPGGPWMRKVSKEMAKV